MNYLKRKLKQSNYYQASRTIYMSNQARKIDYRETPIGELLDEAWQLGYIKRKDGCLIPLIEKANALIAQAEKEVAREWRELLDIVNGCHDCIRDGLQDDYDKIVEKYGLQDE